jgi:competence protein ComEC
LKYSTSANRSLIGGASSYLAGLLLATQFSQLPGPWILASTTAAAAILCFTRLRLLAWCLLGLSWSLGTATWVLHDELPPELQKVDIRITGVVSGIPDINDEDVRFDFLVDQVREPADAKLPRKIRLTWYRSAPAIKAGEHWQLTVRLKRPHGFLNPGGLDYEQWLFLQHIRATGYVREDTSNRAVDPRPSPWSLNSWRQRWFDTLSHALSWSELNGVIIALIMGEESGITQEQWEVLRRTGTAHLVAVSGSHIGLIAGIVFFLTRRLCALLFIQRWSPPTIAAIASLAIATLYSGLAGFSVPTQRALITVAAVMTGIVGRRNVRPFHTLWLALLAVCLWDPFAVLAPGFWLSFGAVALILLDLGYRLRPPGWWFGVVRINWITALGLSPLLLLFFQQVSLISPIANLLAVPTLGLIGVPLALASALALFAIPPLGALLLTITDQWVRDVWLMMEWAAQLPLAQWHHARPPAWTLAFALPGTLLLLAPRAIPARWLGLTLWLPALTQLPDPPAAGSARLTLLDVGQGLAAIVQTSTRTLVFDTGAKFSDSFDMGSAVIEPYLLSQGVERIDTLVVSHGDNDHIGGAPALIESLKPGGILTSVPNRLPGSQLCAAGQSWRWDDVDFEMLSPFSEAASDNDNSCVLKVTGGKHCALLTGDIEKAAEQLLVEKLGDSLRCDVLVAPHHGSNTSSSQPFLDRVHPRYVLIPAGYLNRYGFPHPTVLERYANLGTTVLDSANSGMISVTLDGNPDMKPPYDYRKETGKSWNDAPKRRVP